MTRNTLAAIFVGGTIGALLSTILSLAVIHYYNRQVPDPNATFQLEVREGQWERWCDADTGALLYKNGSAITVIADAECGPDTGEDPLIAEVR